MKIRSDFDFDKYDCIIGFQYQVYAVSVLDGELCVNRNRGTGMYGEFHWATEALKKTFSAVGFELQKGRNQIGETFGKVILVLPSRKAM